MYGTKYACGPLSTTYSAHRYHPRRKKKALGRTLFSTVHGVLFNPHIRTYLLFLLSKQRAPRCSFAAWRFPQVSICTESSAINRGRFGGEIARFRISHLCVNLVLVIGDCPFQLRATGKHVSRFRALPSPVTFNSGQRRATGEHVTHIGYVLGVEVRHVKRS